MRTHAIIACNLICGNPLRPCIQDTQARPNEESYTFRILQQATYSFLAILASTYGPGPYGPEPLVLYGPGPLILYGPGPLIVCKQILSQMLQDHI